MAQYIEKSALVAEIERRKVTAREKAETASDNNNVPVAALWSGKENICNELLSFIDILEVKEVDLEKELIEWHKKHFKKDGTFIGMSGFYLKNNSQMDIAKHFFELGLKAQKGE